VKDEIVETGALMGGGEGGREGKER